MPTDDERILQTLRSLSEHLGAEEMADLEDAAAHGLLRALSGEEALPDHLQAGLDALLQALDRYDRALDPEAPENPEEPEDPDSSGPGSAPTP